MGRTSFARSPREFEPEYCLDSLLAYPVIGSPALVGSERTAGDVSSILKGPNGSSDLGEHPIYKKADVAWVTHRIHQQAAHEYRHRVFSPVPCRIQAYVVRPIRQNSKRWRGLHRIEAVSRQCGAFRQRRSALCAITTQEAINSEHSADHRLRKFGRLVGSAREPGRPPSEPMNTNMSNQEYTGSLDELPKAKLHAQASIVTAKRRCAEPIVGTKHHPRANVHAKCAVPTLREIEDLDHEKVASLTDRRPETIQTVGRFIPALTRECEEADADLIAESVLPAREVLCNNCVPRSPSPLLYAILNSSSIIAACAMDLCGDDDTLMNSPPLRTDSLIGQVVRPIDRTPCILPKRIQQQFRRKSFLATSESVWTGTQLLASVLEAAPCSDMQRFRQAHERAHENCPRGDVQKLSPQTALAEIQQELQACAVAADYQDFAKIHTGRRDMSTFSAMSAKVCSLRERCFDRAKRITFQFSTEWVKSNAFHEIIVNDAHAPKEIRFPRRGNQAKKTCANQLLRRTCQAVNPQYAMEARRSVRARVASRPSKNQNPSSNSLEAALIANVGYDSPMLSSAGARIKATSCDRYVSTAFCARLPRDFEAQSSSRLPDYRRNPFFRRAVRARDATSDLCARNIETLQPNFSAISESVRTGTQLLAPVFKAAPCSDMQRFRQAHGRAHEKCPRGDVEKLAPQTASQGSQRFLTQCVRSGGDQQVTAVPSRPVTTSNAPCLTAVSSSPLLDKRISTTRASARLGPQTLTKLARRPGSKMTSNAMRRSMHSASFGHRPVRDTTANRTIVCTTGDFRGVESLNRVVTRAKNFSNVASTLFHPEFKPGKDARMRAPYCLANVLEKATQYSKLAKATPVVSSTDADQKRPSILNPLGRAIIETSVNSQGRPQLYPQHFERHLRHMKNKVERRCVHTSASSNLAKRRLKKVRCAEQLDHGHQNVWDLTDDAPIFQSRLCQAQPSVLSPRKPQPTQHCEELWRAGRELQSIRTTFLPSTRLMPQTSLGAGEPSARYHQVTFHARSHSLRHRPVWGATTFRTNGLTTGDFRGVARLNKCEVIKRTDILDDIALMHSCVEFDKFADARMRESYRLAEVLEKATQLTTRATATSVAACCGANKKAPNVITTPLATNPKGNCRHLNHHLYHATTQARFTRCQLGRRDRPQTIQAHFVQCVKRGRIFVARAEGSDMPHHVLDSSALYTLLFTRAILRDSQMSTFRPACCVAGRQQIQRIESTPVIPKPVLGGIARQVMAKTSHADRAQQIVATCRERRTTFIETGRQHHQKVSPRNNMFRNKCSGRQGYVRRIGSLPAQTLVASCLPKQLRRCDQAFARCTLRRGVSAHIMHHIVSANVSHRLHPLTSPLVHSRAKALSAVATVSHDSQGDHDQREPGEYAMSRKTNRLRCSKIRVYAVFGAVALSTSTAWTISEMLPVNFYLVLPVYVTLAGAAASLRQMVGISLCPRLLGDADSENSVVGGWSLGSLVAIIFAMQLENLVVGVRAGFWVDARSLQPNPPMRMRLGGRLDLTRALQVPKSIPRIMANAELPFYVSRIAIFDFTCPLSEADKAWMQTDDTVDARRPMYFRAGAIHAFPEANHMTIGLTYAWDIARRLRCGCALYG